MNQRQAFTYLRAAMLGLHASGVVPEDELDWDRAFEALDALEPEDARRLRQLRQDAEPLIGELAGLRGAVLEPGVLDQRLIQSIARLTRDLRAIDLAATKLMDRYSDDLPASAEVLAFRHELRVAAGWLELASLPGLPTIAGTVGP